jgi:hypothetical protein
MNFLKKIWVILESVFGDYTHWKVILRIIYTIGLIYLLIQGRNLDAKITWMVKLFEPIFNVKFPQ